MDNANGQIAVRSYLTGLFSLDKMVLPWQGTGQAAKTPTGTRRVPGRRGCPKLGQMGVLDSLASGGVPVPTEEPAPVRRSILWLTQAR